MSITAKELAGMLGLSEAAISMALNNKPGVSTRTRKRVLDAAKEHGYDFSRINSSSSEEEKETGTIYFIVYRKSGAVVPDLPPSDSERVADIPFYVPLTEGISAACKKLHLYLNIVYVYEGENVSEQIEIWKRIGAKGLILLGTEMNEYDLKPYMDSGLPLVLVDNYYEQLSLDSIMINNVQGAYLATEYLIRRKHAQPGHLQSSYMITGFEERADGFYKAIRRNGMSTGKSAVHRLTPSVEGAYLDMKQLLENGEVPARSYFADNDMIAAGAIRALREAGYRVPQDVAVIGFDDIPLCSYVSPPLTTVHVPKQYMGEMAVKRLTELIRNPSSCPIKMEISTEIVLRRSC